MDQQEYLEQRVDDQIAWYDRKSQSSQTAYKRLKVFEIVAAASIPIMAGLPAQPWQLIAGVVGALIAVCSGVSGLFKFHELWIEYRAVAEILRRHRFLFLTKAAPYQGEDAFALFVDAVEGAIAKENSSWAANRRPISANGQQQEAVLEAPAPA